MKKNLFLLLPMFLFLSSCEVEGPMGPEGPAGQNGKDGQNGNANVVSKVFTIKPSDWIEHGTFGNLYHYYDVTLTVSEITPDIFDNGSVLVYLKSVEDIYAALPFTLTDESYFTTFTFGYRVGSVVIEIQDSDFMTFRPDSQVTAKVVIIESSDS